MSTEQLFSLKNRWFTASVGSLVAIAIVAVAIGFLWIPYAQSNKPVAGWWDAICTAAGLALPWRPAQQPTTPVNRPSNVIVTAQMMQPANSLSIGRGATLALQCTMCHGVRGMSEADSPNLAGQYESAIYKQLRDFKSGHRYSAVMAPMVVNLSDQDMRDLAAYYSFLPRERSFKPGSEQQKAPVLVTNGAPMRNIGACASCHGGIDNKTASPWLEGAPEPYIRAQLKAFASGARRNDINEQMRNVARHMTPEEIDTVARYYSSR